MTQEDKEYLKQWLREQIDKHKGFSLIYWGMRCAFRKVIQKIDTL